MKSIIFFMLFTTWVVSSLPINETDRDPKRLPIHSVPGGITSALDDIQGVAAAAQVPNVNAMRFPNLVNQLANPPLIAPLPNINNPAPPQAANPVLPQITNVNNERFQNVFQLLNHNPVANQPNTNNPGVSQPGEHQVNPGPSLLREQQVNPQASQSGGQPVHSGPQQAVGQRVPTIANPTGDTFTQLLQQNENLAQNAGANLGIQNLRIPNPSFETFQRFYQESQNSNPGPSQGSAPTIADYNSFIARLASQQGGSVARPNQAVQPQSNQVPNEVRYPNLVQLLQAPPLSHPSANQNPPNQQS